MSEKGSFYEITSETRNTVEFYAQYMLSGQGFSSSSLEALSMKSELRITMETPAINNVAKKP
jgi:hypothetical protein